MTRENAFAETGLRTGASDCVAMPKRYRHRMSKRLLLLVAVLGLIATPAAVLRAACVGHSCDEDEDPTAEVPFCSLPADVREPIAAGFEGELHRSPDIMAVTRLNDVAGSPWVKGGTGPEWPSLEPISRDVPLVFAGTGINSDARVPDGTRLDAIAPTLADAVGFKRPNPQVRSGTAVEGVVSKEVPLVVQVAMKGIGSEDLESATGDWPRLKRLIDEHGGTLKADAGSLPLDPAAILTTIGTGGLPSQHGIVGTVVRNNEGEVVFAWGPETPVSIIATLADDLDENFSQRSLVGLIRSDVTDGGLVGGNWYVDVDKDEHVHEVGDPAEVVGRMLDKGYGRDEVPDVIGIALKGDIEEMDRRLGEIEDVLSEQADEWTMAVTSTGTNVRLSDTNHTGREISEYMELQVPKSKQVIEAIVPGGLYIDQDALGRVGLTEDDILGPFAELHEEGPVASASPIFADAFSSFAVSFSRYC